MTFPQPGLSLKSSVPRLSSYQHLITNIVLEIGGDEAPRRR
jgi:hypothetical protein